MINSWVVAIGGRQMVDDNGWVAMAVSNVGRVGNDIIGVFV